MISLGPKKRNNLFPVQYNPDDYDFSDDFVSFVDLRNYANLIANNIFRGIQQFLNSVFFNEIVFFAKKNYVNSFAFRNEDSSGNMLEDTIISNENILCLENCDFNIKDKLQTKASLTSDNDFKNGVNKFERILDVQNADVYVKALRLIDISGAPVINDTNLNSLKNVNYDLNESINLKSGLRENNTYTGINIFTQQTYCDQASLAVKDLYLFRLNADVSDLIISDINIATLRNSQDYIIKDRFEEIENYYVSTSGNQLIDGIKEFQDLPRFSASGYQDLTIIGLDASGSFIDRPTSILSTSGSTIVQRNASGNIFGNNLVYLSDTQNISGTKIFMSTPSLHTVQNSTVLGTNASGFFENRPTSILSTSGSTIKPLGPENRTSSEKIKLFSNR